jgi:hypothetical protein
MRQLCGFLGGINGGHRDKNKVVLRRQVETVELRVRMDCQRCEREVKKALYGMKGWCSPCPMHCKLFSLNTSIVSKRLPFRVLVRFLQSYLFELFPAYFFLELLFWATVSKENL